MEHVRATDSTVQSIYRAVTSIPGSHLVISYIKNSYQHDPFRIVLELFLVFFALKYMLSKKYKPHDNAVKLTEKEVDELVEEWQAEPLVPKLNSFDKFNLETTPVIVGAQAAKAKVQGYTKPLMNLATTNYLNLVESESIREKAIATLKSYGVGSCGPPGFYGTIDVHMDLERDIARFLGTDEAILYSQGFSTISSVIPAFSKRGDLLVVDEGVNFAVQKGVQISRSNVRWFKHNDVADLERVLRDIQTDQLTRPLTRRFIVTEGLFANHGDIVNLPKVVELKKKFKYRLIVDETQSFGVIGRRGAGVTDYYDVDAKEVDIIVGSLSTALCASGGFCAGNMEIVDHQRLSGSAYCFSASMPAMLAVSASEAIKIIGQQPQLIQELVDRARSFRQILSHKSLEPYVQLYSGDAQSPAPFFHIRVKESFLDSQHSAISREDEERLLQAVVDECAYQGLLITRAKYVYDQERVCPRPSIKVFITTGLSKKENDKAANTVKSAITKVFSKWRK
ncbi:pyridoxal phosphate-dependent transferase [Radiomyces spectabilis]|uniref:pyridoxal phosphate-dependent transferase n=1 Tax=Radiomyces spectabilis TaxID=64574 RepID=UPI0022210B34|nr:pyridoxal phosphate-dependent transferase [Radiomyces spectabilis]KAI8379510.1 pyridoxal phosphate-dependent transferase [Radiomyces spectabilis]